MARNIDTSKIERIKDATIQMIVGKGYGGASISEIAKTAGVAEGYLYRHYSSKTDLVQDLLYDSINSLINRFEELTNQPYTVADVFEKLIRTLFLMAKNDVDRIKFLCILMNDYNFKVIDPQKERIKMLLTRMIEQGHASGEIRKDINEEDIYLLSISYPIQFINLRLKGFVNTKELGEEEILKVLSVCMNSIKC
jgi:AcrR family transcriptional regulator